MNEIVSKLSDERGLVKDQRTYEEEINKNVDALFPKIEELWPEKKYKEIGAILTNLKEVHEENIKISL